MAEVDSRLTQLLEIDPNVIGFGLAPKVVGGRLPGALGVTVFVKEKLARADVAAGLMVPDVIETGLGRLATDVVQMSGLATATAAATDRVRPVVGGSAIGVNNVTGSLGPLVKDSSGTVHVLTTAGLATLGGQLSNAKVYQPPGAASGDVVGSVVKTASLSLQQSLYPRLKPFVYNAVDAALIKPTSASVVSEELRGGAFPPASATHPLVGVIIGAQVEDDGRAVYIVCPADRMMSALGVTPYRAGSVRNVRVDEWVHFVGAAEGTREGRVQAIDVSYKVLYAGSNIGVVKNTFLMNGAYGAVADIGAGVYGWAGNGVDSHCTGCQIAADLERTYGVALTGDIPLADMLRDDWLLKTSTGRMLVSMFYKNEATLRSRIGDAKPTQSELDYAKLLYDKYTTMVREELTHVSMNTVPVDDGVLDEIRAALYGLSRFMTAAEYAAGEKLVAIVEETKGLTLREAMDFMDSGTTLERFRVIIASVPGWDTSYDAG